MVAQLSDSSGDDDDEEEEDEDGMVPIISGAFPFGFQSPLDLLLTECAPLSSACALSSVCPGARYPSVRRVSVRMGGNAPPPLKSPLLRFAECEYLARPFGFQREDHLRPSVLQPPVNRSLNWLPRAVLRFAGGRERPGRYEILTEI